MHTAESLSQNLCVYINGNATYEEWKILQILYIQLFQIIPLIIHIVLSYVNYVSHILPQYHLSEAFALQCYVQTICPTCHLIDLCTWCEFQFIHVESISGHFWWHCADVCVSQPVETQALANSELGKGKDSDLWMRHNSGHVQCHCDNICCAYTGNLVRFSKSKSGLHDG